jgi:hypothetical protein
MGRRVRTRAAAAGGRGGHARRRWVRRKGRGADRQARRRRRARRPVSPPLAVTVIDGVAGSATPSSVHLRSPVRPLEHLTGATVGPRDYGSPRGTCRFDEAPIAVANDSSWPEDVRSRARVPEADRLRTHALRGRRPSLTVRRPQSRHPRWGEMRRAVTSELTAGPHRPPCCSARLPPRAWAATAYERPPAASEWSPVSEREQLG